MAEISIDGVPIPCPRESPNSRNDRDGKPPRLIVLHSTGGGFEGAVRWLMSRVSRVSAHFVVSRAGEIRQLVSLRRIAYHAGESHYTVDGVPLTNINNHSIGIEMAHIDNEESWPPAQIEAVAKLCAAIIARHNAIYAPGWPRLGWKSIVGHDVIAVPRGRKIDPYLFPWKILREKVKGYLA